MRIDIWSDIACPWCYLGLTRFERVLAGFEHADEVEVTLHSFQLDPSLPDRFDGTEAQYLATRKGLPDASIRQMFAQVQQAAATEGLTLDFDTVQVANSRRAHRLLHAAQHADETGRLAWRVKLALFEAHFVAGESIGDADTLVRIAGEAGLPETDARAALESPELEDEVAGDIRQARAYGIGGVPFFVLDGRYGISGAQPREVFAGALRQVWDELHPAPTPLTPLGVGVSGGESCGVDGCD